MGTLRLSRFLARPLLAGVAVSLAPLAILAQPRPNPIVAQDSDPILTVKVRAALGNHPDLAALNLIVSVSDRVAVVGGPIPDAALTPKIEAAIRTVVGLQDVKVSCYVVPPEDPLESLVGERLKTTAKPAPAFTPPVLGIRNPLPTSAPRPATAPRPQATVTAQRVVPFEFLLSPVPPTGSRIVTPLPMPARTSYPTIPPTSLPIDPVVELEPMMTTLRAEPRFAGLAVAVKGGTAVVSGTVRADADAWEFARRVRTAAGVDRVVIEKVTVR